MKIKEIREASTDTYAYRWITNRVDVKIADVNHNINVGGRVDSNGRLFTTCNFHKRPFREMSFAKKRIAWFRDNCGTIQVASKAILRGYTKHASIELKWKREYVERGLVELKYLGTKSKW